VKNDLAKTASTKKDINSTSNRRICTGMAFLPFLFGKAKAETANFSGTFPNYFVARRVLKAVTFVLG
jgi:hypothetical protein